MKKKFFKIIFLSFFALSNAVAEKVNVFNFTKKELKTLKVGKKYKGETTWTLGSNENGNFIKAEAEGMGSGLGKEVLIDLSKTPIINITWKVEKDLSGILENSKKGHDYAARVFVIKKTGSTALSNRAINYVFSSNNDVGKNWPSPYTKKSIDYVLSSTKNDLNTWVTVKANVKEDFMELHGIEVLDISGVAIMTDTDNSKLKAVSFYQNIYFSDK
ncbi:DUF3047 domain-containing protein [Candidatus Pelagibacter sp.]|jgi:hypothetical protein|nr:DUF3047 domain-containing protein [Candidatus Pelagibacter sp.]|tara:strand:- start:2393 stop:3040 length:648 start_codon:yes stop_codon:yes gene_type:complete